MELIREDNVFLSDGKKYSGWGYYQDNEFIPYGCGKKFFDGYYALGNFKNGILDGGPAIISHDYYMHTIQFKNNRGNGWGMFMNRGMLIEFGYYKDSKLLVNLLNFVEWYFSIIESCGRHREDMLNIYRHKETKQVNNLLIGYSPKKYSNGLVSSCMGFLFKEDGSVWVGTTQSLKRTGNLIHFRKDGLIDAGKFEDGTLVARKSILEIIDYYGKTGQNFRNIPEIKIGYDYINGNYVEDDLPF